MGAPSDDEGEGFADDQVPVRARPTDIANIPRVEDKIGLLIQEHFESFIEGCANSFFSFAQSHFVTFASHTCY